MRAKQLAFSLEGASASGVHIMTSFFKLLGPYICLYFEHWRTCRVLPAVYRFDWNDIFDVHLEVRYTWQSHCILHVPV